MKELASQIKNELDKRMSNPFLASFFLSAASINYKIIFVLASNEDYKIKFNYIENTLYQCYFIFAIKFILLPLISSMFFCFVWPFIDTKISVNIIKIQNRKKLAILKEERKTPFDEHEQAAYFLQHDKKIAEANEKTFAYKTKLVEQKKSTEEKIEKLKNEIKRQALCRLADGTNLSVNDINLIFNLEHWNLVDNNRHLFNESKKIYHMKNIFIVANEIKNIPFTEDHRKIGTIEWLAGIINSSEDYAVGFHGILCAIDLAGDIDENSVFYLLDNEIKINIISDLWKSIGNK